MANDNFRHVIFTAPHSQVVLMCLLPGEEIGTEVHENVDQFFRFESGTGKSTVNGEDYPLSNGTAVLVPAGSQHNIVNTSSTDKLKFYTIYSPANHPDGVIHQTKADSEAHPDE